MAQLESISQHILGALEQLQAECMARGFLTHEEEGFSRRQKAISKTGRDISLLKLLNLSPFTVRNEKFPVQQITLSNVIKLLYANGMKCQSRGDLIEEMKSMGAPDFIIKTYEPIYERILRTVARGMQEQLTKYLCEYRPFCTLSFQELISPDNVALMLLYVTFTPTNLTEQVTLYLGMIPIPEAGSDGERHEILLRNLSIFIAENSLGEYFAECLTAVNATPDCAIHELLLGDCLLSVVNKNRRQGNDRVVWCCNLKNVIHRAMNALYLIFPLRSFPRSEMGHRFSEMFQFSIYFITRLQTFFISHEKQIRKTMEKMSISLPFEKLLSSNNIVAPSFQSVTAMANLFNLKFIVEDVPLFLRVLQELVADRDNWDSSLRMCSKAWVLRRVLQQPKFLAFMILLGQTVEAISIFQDLPTELHLFDKRDQVEYLITSIDEMILSLEELREKFPCIAFKYYEIKSNSGSWMPLNHQDNVDLGFNPPSDHEIRYTTGNYHVSFAATRFNEDDQVERIFNDLRKSAKSSFCKYTEDYDLFSNFLDVDFLPLCTENRDQYFEIILDEIEHYSSLYAIEAWFQHLSPDSSQNQSEKKHKKRKKTNKRNRNDNLTLARLNTLHFDDYNPFEKGAYYVSQLPKNVEIVKTAEAFIGIAHNGVGVDRFNLSARDFTTDGARKNRNPNKVFRCNSRDKFIEKLFAV